MLITTHLEVNLEQQKLRNVVYAVQNDCNTRAVALSLFSGGSKWTPPDGTTAAVSFGKPDGTGGLYDTLPDGNTKAVTVTENVVTAVFAPQVLSCPGRVDVSIALYDSDLNRLGLFPFPVFVSKDPSNGETVSNNYFYLSTFAAVNEAIGNLKDLKTLSKDSLVAAINELVVSGGSTITEEQIQTAVNAYLEKHPVGSTPIDSTLTLEGYAADAKATGVAISKLSGQNPYTLPVATAETLGGVKPVTKTDAMTQPVGVDANGALFTAPSESGGVTDEQIGDAVSDYLDAHPEATMTVQDGSITTVMLSDNLAHKLHLASGGILGNTEQAEGSTSFAEMFQKVKNEVMLAYMGDINKIPAIAHTDQHSQLNGKDSIINVFNTIDLLVNWNDISKIFNLGDCILTGWKDASDIPWLACTELDNMVKSIAPIPLQKQLNVFGNHDRYTWDSTANTYGERFNNQACLQQYFRNVDAHRRSNNGWFTVEDGYFNVKYVVTSAYEDTTNFASTAQIDFLISELAKDDGYDIVLLAHELYNPDYVGRVFPTTSDMVWKVSAENDNSYGMGINVNAILSARKRKTTGTFTDASGVVHEFDFSGCKTDLLCSIHGHTHYETYNYVDECFLNVAISPLCHNNRWLYFFLIDRANQMLRVWKMPTADGLDAYVYEQYDIPFDVSDRESFTIKNRLLNCTVFNSSTTIKEGQPYSQYVKARSGYSLGDVIVSMGDTDVTTDCYDVTTGLIHIESVSGDIVVKAVDSTGDISQNFYTVTANFGVYTGYVSKAPGSGTFTVQNTIVGDDGSYTIKSIRTAGGYLPKLSVVVGGEDITHDVVTWQRAFATATINPVTDDVVITVNATPIEYMQTVIYEDGTEEESADWYTSEYLDVSMYDSISTQCTQGTMYVALYDANKEFVTRLTGGTIYIGTNTKYIRLIAASNQCAIIDRRESVSYAINANIADGLTSTDINTSIKAGSSYENTISISSEEVVAITVTVTMGGTDITSTAYSDGKIYIPYVTGDIVITAKAIKEILYEIQNVTLDGTSTVDTGVALMDVDKDYSVVVDCLFTTRNGIWGNYVSTNAILLQFNSNKLQGFFSGTWSNSSIIGLEKRCKAVLTHVAGSGVGKWYMANESSAEVSTYEATATRPVTSEHNIILGGRASGEMMSVGTIYDFKIYGKVLTDEEIAEYMTFEETAE